MKAQIEALAERGRPNLFALVHGGAVQWPMEMLVSTGAGVHQYSTVANVPDTLGIFAWTHKDALLKKLDTEIAASLGDGTDASSTRPALPKLSPR
ncbi:MAG TPA: hypothetical protein VMT22_17065 [Terriglobales bacterium]|nr:hypothetical protein [Terriglobales bacterium]